MIPKECKRLAEVDFPIATVSRHAAREKSIRHGHPSTLHLWWARRPLASSRAMLLALLLPDPCDPLCPDDFKTKAKTVLLNMPGRPTRWDIQLLTDIGLQRALLSFIADFANWDNSAHQAFVTTGRELVNVAHPEETPLVVDPFAGGGSIPLEALRLGADAFASDINPVAGLILKVLLDDIPRHGPGLANELRKAGKEIKAEAEKELADLYAKDPDGATPIAYLWARTVHCESPNCGAEIPLMQSMWLCRKPKRKWAMRPFVVQENGVPPKVEFEIFQPTTNREVAGGTVARARATCLSCRSVLAPERVRNQLTAQQGGSDAVFDKEGNRIGGARLTAVVTLKPGQPGRHYRLPTEADYAAVVRAQAQIGKIVETWERQGKRSPCPVPDEPTPLGGGSGAGRAFSVQRYGMFQWGDLFTARQKTALIEFVKLTNSEQIETRYNRVRNALALAISKNSDYCSNLGSWHSSGEKVRNIFSRQAIPMVWDFTESNPLCDASGNWMAHVEWVAKVIERQFSSHVGGVEIADAMEHPLPDQSADVWFTDPPYYDAVPYADLSDFFLAWLKRSLPGHPMLRDPFDPSNLMSPKTVEIVQDETKLHAGSPKNRAWFEESMAKVFKEGHRVLSENGVGSVVFAHKTTEGWEALLSGLIRGGWTITGSWPIATEMTARLRARESAALATSVHLVCRPRPEDAKVGDWSSVLRELPVRVGQWMERLQGEDVRGADLVFACIGPALEIFSRYSAVESASGEEVTLTEYLEKVWEVVGRAALDQVLGAAEAQARNGAVGALEEDARLTALFLWTMQSSGEENSASGDEPADDEPENDAGTRQKKGYKMPFDVTRRFAQPLGIHLDEWKSRIIDIEKGVVRLLPVAERSSQLLTEDENDPLLDEIEIPTTSALQPRLLPEETPWAGSRPSREFALAAMEPEPTGSGQHQRRLTTLDRVHMAMLFQASGRSAALRAMLQAEHERGPYFMRLANALSALYPSSSSEKRLLDAMLLAVPR